MKRYSKELIIGLSVLIAALLLFFGINYLKGINVFKAANYYYISYENVNGLSVSSPVTVNGYKIGQVREISYEYDNPGHVLVEISIDKQLKVPAGSKAIIQNDLLGTASIVLKFTTSSQSHTIGDKIIGENAPSMIDNVSNELLPAVTTIFPKVDSLLTSVNRLVNDSAILMSIKRLDRITANLELTTASLQRTVSALPSTMSTIHGIAQNLDTITDDLAVLAADLKQLPIKSTMENVENITTNLNTATQQLTRTDNSLGLLLNDRQLYDHINGAATALDTLLWDLKKNPKRYIPKISVF